MTSEKCILYVFTNEDLWASGKVKIGDTTRTAKERVNEQHSTAVGSKLELFGQWDITGFRDHNVHKSLAKDPEIIWLDPKHTGSAREIFQSKGKDRKWWIDILSEIVNELKSGVRRKNSYGPRDEQEECEDKVVLYHQQGGICFLIAANMRFGKTFVCYNICKKINAKNVLILSYRPAASYSWRDELDDHVVFEGSRYYDYKEQDTVPVFNARDMNVVFVSCQSMLHELGRFDWVKETDWDVVILDEEHYGTATQRATELLNEIKRKFTLHVSGTPYRSLALGMFSDENTFTWSYCDTQEKKQEEIEKNRVLPEFEKTHQYTYSAPKMVLLGYQLAPEIVKDLKEIGDAYDEDENPNFRKILSVNERNEFRHPSAVSAILDQLGGWKHTGSNIFSNDAERACGNEPLDPKMLEHTLWMIPGIKEGEALERMLRKHQRFGEERYDYILAVGDNETDIQRTKDAIKLAQSLDKKTITISCGRFTEAVTVPQWGAVVWLSDVRSPTTYWQASFRPMSKWEEFKDRIYIIDMHINRMLSAVYHLCKQNRRQHEGTIESIKRFLRNAPLYTANGDLKELLEVDPSFLFKVASKLNVSTLFDGSSVDASFEFSQDEHDRLQSLDPSSLVRLRVDLRQGITDVGVRSGKTSTVERKRREKEKKGEDSEDLKLKEQLILAAMLVEQRLPSYMLVSKKQARCVDDILSQQDDVSQELFKRHVGVTLETFSVLLGVGRLRKDVLDDRIDAFGQLEQDILDADSFENALDGVIMLSRMIRAENTEIMTPPALVKRMLDLLQDEIWSSVDKTFCDPTCGRGMFLFETIRRLWSGLSDVIHDETERAKNIISRVDGVDISQVQHERLKALFSLLFSRFKIEQTSFRLYNVDSLEHDLRKYSVVMGNPPYNRKGKKQFHQDFIKRAFELCSLNGKVILVSPFQFMNARSEHSFRNEVLTRASLISVEILGQVFQGNDVETAITAWTITQGFQTFSVIHLDGKQTQGFVHDGFFLFPRNGLEHIRNAKRLLSQHSCLKFIRAGYTACDKSTRAIWGYTKGSTTLIFQDLSVKHSSKVDEFIKQEQPKFWLLYNEFVGIGRKKKPFDRPIDIINGPELPPTNDRLLIVAAEDAEKMQWYLSHPIIQNIHDAFHAQSHIGTTLQGHVPDLHKLLDDDVAKRENQMIEWFVQGIA